MVKRISPPCIGDLIVIQDKWCPEIPVAYRIKDIIAVSRNGIKEDYYVLEGNRPGVYLDEILLYPDVDSEYTCLGWPFEWILNIDAHEELARIIKEELQRPRV